MSYCVAIVLAAGQGKRMGSNVPKQFLEIDGKPVIYYSLKQMEHSFLDEIILVTAEKDIFYCQKEIVEKYGFSKVTKVIAGGEQRYHSVYNGLCAIESCDFVFIHDGARPFLDEEILKRNLEAVSRFGACVTGMPVKDTIKKCGEDGFVEETPRRELLWQVQTPQTFRYSVVKKSYDKFLDANQKNPGLYEMTDDAMVVETFGKERVMLVAGDYKNVKITTPEDLILANAFLQE